MNRPEMQCPWRNEARDLFVYLEFDSEEGNATSVRKIGISWKICREYISLKIKFRNVSTRKSDSYDLILLNFAENIIKLVLISPQIITKFIVENFVKNNQVLSRCWSNESSNYCFPEICSQTTILPILYWKLYSSLKETGATN